MKIEIFSTDFWKNTQTSNFMQIRQFGAELFHADGQTDTNNEVITRYSQFRERD
jgi:hypothetical protein